MKQKGLGRGLDAIFGSDPVDAKLKPMSQMAEIEIADIIPNPTQPRTQFDEEALDELADSIRQLGVIQPVTVKKGDGGKYVIISGNHDSAERIVQKNFPEPSECCISYLLRRIPFHSQPAISQTDRMLPLA